jgi:hypothetical protein
MAIIDNFLPQNIQVSDKRKVKLESLLRDIKDNVKLPDYSNYEVTRVKELKPQNVKQSISIRKVSGGRANFDGELGIYIPDYRPTDSSKLTSTPIIFSRDTLLFNSELVGYSGKDCHFFLRRLSNLYKYAGNTCPHIYISLNGREYKIGTIKHVDNSVLIRFIPELPEMVISRCSNWLTRYELEDIGMLYPILGNNGFNYRSIIDSLESVMIENLDINRAICYALVDLPSNGDDNPSINLLDNLGDVARYGKTANIELLGDIYLTATENSSIRVSRLQLKPKQFLIDWLSSFPLAKNRTVLRDNNPVTGKKQAREYNRAQKSKKYGKGKAIRK